MVSDSVGSWVGMELGFDFVEQQQRGGSRPAAQFAEGRSRLWRLQEGVDGSFAGRSGELDGGFYPSGGVRCGARGGCHCSNDDHSYGGDPYGSGGGYHGYDELGETTMAMLRGNVRCGSSGSLVPPAGATPTRCSTMGLNNCEERNGGGSCSSLQKIQFPTFQGDNPHIWKAKCLEYFRIYNISKYMWVLATTMHMEGSAADWWQMYKSQHGLCCWNHLMHAMEEQFGTHEDQQARIGNFSVVATELFDEKPLENVVWDEELLHDLDSHDDLLGQLAQGGKQFVDDERKSLVRPDFSEEQNSVNVTPLQLVLGLDGVNTLFNELPLKMVVWDEEVPCNINTWETLLQQLARGAECLVDEDTTSITKLDAHDKLPHVYDVQLLHRDAASDAFGMPFEDKVATPKSEEEAFMASGMWNTNARDVFQDISCEVQWDEEQTPDHDEHSDLLQHIAAGIGCLDGENFSHADGSFLYLVHRDNVTKHLQEQCDCFCMEKQLIIDKQTWLYGGFSPGKGDKQAIKLTNNNMISNVDISSLSLELEVTDISFVADKMHMKSEGVKIWEEFKLPEGVLVKFELGQPVLGNMPALSHGNSQGEREQQLLSHGMTSRH